MSGSAQSTVERVVAETLVAWGVEAVFGVIGSGNFFLANELRDAGATVCTARDERGALMMADGYGRASGRLAVCTTHQGPGFTNTLTGLVEAAKARTPLLLLTADVPAGVGWSNFKIGQAAIAQECGALVERIGSPATAAADTARAVRRAIDEQLPVVLQLPTDLSCAAAPAGVEGPPAGGHVRGAPAPAADQLQAAAEILAAAAFPLIVAGRGAVVSPGARVALLELAERSGALLATSAMAHGFFAGDPFALGILGGLSSPVAVELCERVDAVVSFGAGLNHWTVRRGQLLPVGAPVVQVDLDPTAPGRLHRCAVAVVGDAGETARALLAALPAGPAPTGARTPAVAAAIATRRWSDEPFSDEGDATHIDPRTLSIALDALLPAERTVVVDSGHFLGYPAMHLAVPDARGFVFANAFQSIGLGLGAAVGAAVARPDRLCVAALGDGGTMMALGEIETAVRLGLGLVILIYNDAAYGAEVHHFGPQGHRVDLTQFADADLAAVARAFGADGITVRCAADLAPVTEWLARRDRPLVIDAKVQPTVVAAWLEEAFQSH